MLKLGKGYCLVHGEVFMFTRDDGTMVHYVDEKEDGIGKPCMNLFVENPPPPPLEEWEWELLFEAEGEVYGTETI